MSNKFEHYKEKQIYFYRTLDEKTCSVYDGSEIFTMTHKEKINILKNNFKQSFILVINNSNNDDDMKRVYKEYISKIEEIKQITDGKINMFKTGTIGNTAMSIFTKLNNIQADDIKEYEFPFLQNGGGVRYAQNEYNGKGYKYDINSYYPSLMLSRYIKIPLKEGTLIDITSDQLNQMRCVKYGVYHVYIECDDPVIFSTIKTNMYSHFEVNYAKKLGLKINVLGKCITWDKEDMDTFYNVFNKYVKYMYPLKTKHKKIKEIFNALWGFLVSKKGGGNVKYHMNYEDIDHTKYKIKKVTSLDNTMTKCEVMVSTKINFYRTHYARMNPFLLGYARVNMHKTFDKVGYDNVLYSHTDSVILKVNVSSKFKISFKIGDWKYEGYNKKCKIYNKNSYEF